MARSTLDGFVLNRVPAGQRSVVQTQLEAWYRRVKRAKWASSAELKEDFGTASVVSAERVVFNIKGNDYRLVVGVNYPYQNVQIKWLGTHKEYDSINVKEVEYEKRRYSRQTDSK